MNELIVARAMFFGYQNSFKLIDKGNVEVFGPLGFAYNLKLTARNFSSQQSGYLYHYTYVMACALFALLTFSFTFLFDCFVISNVPFFCLIGVYVFHCLNL
jgi:hypothetical protein